MAKDGTNRGGRRVRAGAKPDPLKDKLEAGKPASRLLEPADLDSYTTTTRRTLPTTPTPSNAKSPIFALTLLRRRPRSSRPGVCCSLSGQSFPARRIPPWRTPSTRHSPRSPSHSRVMRLPPTTTCVTPWKHT